MAIIIVILPWLRNRLRLHWSKAFLEAESSMIIIVVDLPWLRNMPSLNRGKASVEAEAFMVVIVIIVTVPRSTARQAHQHKDQYLGTEEG